MKKFTCFLLIISFLFTLSGTLHAQDDLSFIEKGWETIFECTECANCSDQLSDVEKNRKFISFYCDDNQLGSWYLIKVHLKTCDSTFYLTGNDFQYNIGASEFNSEELAFLDIFREVRIHCKKVGKISNLGTQRLEYADFIIQNFHKPFPNQTQKSEKSQEVVFKVVEQMPMFPGCENQGLSKVQKLKCANETMLQFIYRNLKYPQAARENGIEGMVVLRYVVEEDGQISNAEIIRDIGHGCGEAALDIVNSMPKWIPGIQRGKPVRVQFNLPVKFRLP